MGDICGAALWTAFASGTLSLHHRGDRSLLRNPEREALTLPPSANAPGPALSHFVGEGQVSAERE